MYWRIVLSMTLTAITPACAHSQSRAALVLLQRQFVSGELAVKEPAPVQWLDGGKSYVAIEPSATVKAAQDLVRHHSGSEAIEVLVSASQLIPNGSSAPLSIDGYWFSGDLQRLLIFTNSRRTWHGRTLGDYWVLDRKGGTLRKLGGVAPPASLMFAKFSPDGSRAAYVRANNLYVENISSGAVEQLTTDGSRTIINGATDWVYAEEFSLLDGFRWSPDGRHIAYWQFDTGKTRTYSLVYDTGAPFTVVTGIPYPEFGVYPDVVSLPYPQPGTPNSSVRVGVVPVEGGATRWMQVPGDPANNYIPRMEWTADSSALALQHMNRLQNTNDMLLADINTGAVSKVFEDTDPAWVDVVDEVKWLHDGSEFLWVSERDGWRHAYLISRDGSRVRLVTKGAFDVIEVVGVDPGEQWLYYLASPEDATRRYLYRTRLDGTSVPERLTPADQPGTHSYEVSPGLHWAVHTYSTYDSPPRTEFVRLPEHTLVRVLEDNAQLRSSLKEIPSSPTEFFRVNIGDGVTLDGWLMKPRDFDPSRKYPILVYVYGEPAGQTALDHWDARNEIFHRALANDGYLIASFDNRGTPAPKGRAWRKIVYGEMGVLSSKEQASALQAIERTRPYIDRDRVAVWGRSGGGSNTLNLMFRHPEIYKVGMSVAPVPDQRLYDSIYQERYMGLPQNNPAGYKAGSPINFADGLQGKLLLVHGSGDDNVHYQGTELLVNRLIELGKPFDFMTYPGRTHAINEGSGTAFHLYGLLARYLEEHLPAGPVPDKTPTGYNQHTSTQSLRK